MKLSDWLKAQKEKRAERKRIKLERRRGDDAAEFQQLGADTEGIEPPESRFTEEYREFLEKQQAEREAAENREIPVEPQPEEAADDVGLPENDAPVNKAAERICEEE